MEQATLTSKSQLTLPKTVREALGVSAGDKILFVPARNGFRLVVVKRQLDSLYGVAGRRKRPLSIAGIKKAIARMGSEEEAED